MGLTVKDLERLGPAAQKQVLEKLGLVNQPKQVKYHNEKDERGTIEFASKREAARYDELLLLLKSEKIRKLKLQPQFTLQESYITPEGERIRAVKYVADFSYERPAAPDKYGQVVWLLEVEDAKGVRTEKYKLKKKIMQEKFGIAVKEV